MLLDYACIALLEARCPHGRRAMHLPDAWLLPLRSEFKKRQKAARVAKEREEKKVGLQWRRTAGLLIAFAVSSTPAHTPGSSTGFIVKYAALCIPRRRLKRRRQQPSRRRLRGRSWQWTTMRI